jgi:hypothetical protein
MQSEGNAPKKMENGQLVLPARQFSSTLVGLVKGFLAKHSVTTLEHSACSRDLTPADFLLVPSHEISTEGTGLL